MDTTVLSMLADIEAKLVAITSQITALQADVAALQTQDLGDLVSLRQLVSDTQAAVLHVQDTLGHA